MTFATVAKNQALDGVIMDQLSLHTDYPGTTGASEVTGGSPAYAREAATFNASSGGARLLNASVAFDVPACTIKWIGVWGAGSFKFAIPNGGGLYKNFVVSPSLDLVYATGHGYSDTQKIVFFGAPPGGITEGVTYFVRDALTDTFAVAATSGGTALDLSSGAGSGCWVVAITEQVHSVQGTHTVTAGSLSVPD
jgi:hypothetical protein